MSLRKHGSFTWEDGATSLETLEAEGKGTEGEDRLESFKNNINFEIQFSSSKKTRQDNPYFLYRLVETISPNSSFFFFFKSEHRTAFQIILCGFHTPAASQDT